MLQSKTLPYKRKLEVIEDDPVDQNFEWVTNLPATQLSLTLENLKRKPKKEKLFST